MLKNPIRSLCFVLTMLLSFSAWAEKVNVNKATVEEIADGLHGVGPVKAEAILIHCQEEKCSKPEDLLKVKGIGTKTMEKIEKDVKFKDEK